MAGHPALSDGLLFEIATYLSQSGTGTEIHAEVPFPKRKDFEQEYAVATKNYPIPASTKKAPYYVWPKGTNKQAKQLRIYFARVAPEPPPIRRLYTDHGKWHGMSSKYRINHSNLVMQLFECGFVLGDNSRNAARIARFMRRRFPVR